MIAITPSGPLLKPQSGYQVTIPPGSQDVVIQLNGTEVLRISLGTTMAIKSQNDLLFEAPNITLKADKSVTIQSGSGTLTLKSGAMMSLECGSSMAMKSCSTMSLKSGGEMDLRGSTVNVN
ncbi:MAG TPA: hypothetical protein VGL53_19700 [Bryobacteraceae bacterium]|jgi:hypothetical protein